MNFMCNFALWICFVCHFQVANAAVIPDINLEIQKRECARFLSDMQKLPICPGHRLKLDDGFDPSAIPYPRCEGWQGRTTLPFTFFTNNEERRVEISTYDFRCLVQHSRYSVPEAESIKLSWSMGHKGENTHLPLWNQLTVALLDRNHAVIESTISALAHAVLKNNDTKHDINTLASIREMLDKNALVIMASQPHDFDRTDVVIISEADTRTDFLSPLRAVVAKAAAVLSPKTPKNNTSNASPKDKKNTRRDQAKRSPNASSPSGKRK